MFKKMLKSLTVVFIGVFLLVSNAFANGSINGEIQYSGSIAGFNYVVWLSTAPNFDNGFPVPRMDFGGTYLVNELATGTSQYNFGGVIANYSGDLYVYSFLDKDNDYIAGWRPSFISAVNQSMIDPGEPMGKSGVFYFGDNSSFYSPAADFAVSDGPTPPTINLVEYNNSVPATNNYEFFGDVGSSGYNLKATASDNGTITEVKFYLQQSWSQIPVLISTGTGAGNYFSNLWKIYNDNNIASDPAARIFATAKDNDNMVSTSTFFTVKILKQNTPKIITITKPVANGTVNANPFIVNATFTGAAKCDGTSDLRLYISQTPGALGTGIQPTPVSGVDFIVGGATFTWNTTGIPEGTTCYLRVRTHLDVDGTTYYESVVTTCVVSGSNNPPTATFSSPGQGANLNYSPVTIDCQVSDPDSNLTGYSLYYDNPSNVIQDGSAGPGTTAMNGIQWNVLGLSNGQHYLYLKAIDSNGAIAISTRTVEINFTTPMVTILQPTNGATISGLVTISGTCMDRTAAPSLGGSYLYTDYSEGGWIANQAVTLQTTPYYSFMYVLDTTQKQNGTIPIRIRVEDGSPNYGFGEAQISVTINNGGDITPAITITSSTGPYIGGLLAQGTVTDDIGIKKIEFYVDGVFKGEIFENEIYPNTNYSFSRWIDLSSLNTGGNKVLTVRAYDNLSNVNRYGINTLGMYVDLSQAGINITMPANDDAPIGGYATISAQISNSAAAPTGVKLLMSNNSSFPVGVDTVEFTNFTQGGTSPNWNYSWTLNTTGITGAKYLKVKATVNNIETSSMWRMVRVNENVTGCQVTVPNSGFQATGPINVKGVINPGNLVNPTVTNVEFYWSQNPGTWNYDPAHSIGVGTLSGSEYVYNWAYSNMPDGMFYVRMKANINYTPYYSPEISITKVTNNAPQTGGGMGGTVFYNSPSKQNGTLRIVLSNNQTLTPGQNAGNWVREIPMMQYDPYNTMGAQFMFNYVANAGSYYAHAFVDINNNGTYEANEPSSSQGDSPQATPVSIANNAVTQNVYIYMYNPANFSFLDIKDPQPNAKVYQNVYFNVEASHPDKISKVEFYDTTSGANTLLRTWDNYRDYYSNEYQDPCYPYFTWDIPSNVSGSKQITAKAYSSVTGNIISALTKSVTIDVSAQALLFFNGNVRYEGQKSGDIKLRAYSQAAYQARMTTNAASGYASIDTGGYFTLNVPSAGDYYLWAFMDIDKNNTYSPGNCPASGWNGPFHIEAYGSSNQYQYVPDQITLFDSTGTVAGGISGEIKYEATNRMYGPKIVEVRSAPPPTTGNGNADFEKQMKFWGDFFPMQFNVPNVSAGTKYVFAYVDANNNNMYDPQGGMQPPDPVGFYDSTTGTTSITCTGDPLRLDKAISIRNPGTQGGMYMPPGGNVGVGGSQPGGNVGIGGSQPGGNVGIGGTYPQGGGGYMPGGSGYSYMTSGTNKIKGTISFPNGPQVSYMDKIVVTAYDKYNQSDKAQTTIWGLGQYEINNLPDISYCVVEAFIDYNKNAPMGNTGNAMPDGSEPRVKTIDSFALSQSTTVVKNLELAPYAVQKSTIMVTLIGYINEQVGGTKTKLGNATVRLYDSGGFDDWMPENDVLISSATSSSSLSSYNGNSYNFTIASVPVAVSEQFGAKYRYEFKVAASGKKTSQRSVDFTSYDAGQTKYIGEITLEGKPTRSPITVTQSRTTLTPSNMWNEASQVDFSFNYEVSVDNPSSFYMDKWQYGAQVQLVIDTDNDGVYEPMERGIFVNLYGKEFVKWNPVTQKTDPTVFIDFMNPDYTRLKGPLSPEDRDKYTRGYDSTRDMFVGGDMDPLNYNYGDTKATKEVHFTWEGRDNNWQFIKNGVYNWKLMVDDSGPSVDESDGLLVAPTTGTITIASTGLGGYVKIDGSTVAVAGAKVEVGGPGGWGQTYTNENGYFEVTGLSLTNSGDSYGGYHISVDADGYAPGEMNNISITTEGSTKDVGTIYVKSGIAISGKLIIPNAPVAGTIKDKNSNMIVNELWGGIEVMRMDAPGWSREEVRVQLPTVSGTSVEAPYSISLGQGKYQMQVRLQGYISKSEEFEIVSSTITKNITLSKAATLKGKVKLPLTAGDSEGIQNFLNQVKAKNYGGQDVWIGINAESKNRKFHSFANANFPGFELQQPNATFEKEFVFEDLQPDTTYTLRVETNGLFANSEVKDIPVGQNKVISDTILLSYGAKIKGKVYIADNINSKIDSLNYGGGWWQGMGKEGVPVYVNVRNVNDGSMGGVDLWISSTTYPQTASFEIRGLSTGTHELEITGIRGVDMAPSAEKRTFIIPQSALTTAYEIFTTTITAPTGRLTGKITNSSGKTIDWDKVAVAMVTTGDNDSGGPQPVTVTKSPDGDFGVISASGLITSEMLAWGSEYSLKPTGSDVFGIPTGNAGTFMETFHVKSGATTEVNFDLKPAASILFTVNGATSTIADIYTKTTTYISNPKGIAPCIAKVQPVALRKLAEQMGSKKAEDEYGDQGPKEKEIALNAQLINRDNYVVGVSTYLTFEARGLEEGVYFMYPLVNFTFNIFELNNSNNAPTASFKFAYASSPQEDSVLLGAGMVVSKSFTLGSGQTVSGSVTRQSADSGTAQTVKVSLRNPATLESVKALTVTYTTSTYTSNTQSFKFENIAPAKYLLVIETFDSSNKLAYKPYSKTVEVEMVDKNVGSIQLERGATLTGKIADQNGNGVSENVYLTCEAEKVDDIDDKYSSYRNSDDFGIEVSSDSATRGTFYARNLPGGVYKITAMVRSGAINLATKTKSQITVQNVSGSETDIGVISLKKATTIKGKVLDPSGKPLNNIKVAAYPQDVQSRENRYYETTTDKDGVFIVKGIEPYVASDKSTVKVWEVKVNLQEEDMSKKLKSDVVYGERVVTGIDLSKATEEKGIVVDDITLAVANSSVKGLVATSDVGGKLIAPFLVQVSGTQKKDFPAAIVVLQSQADLASGDPMQGRKVLTDSQNKFEIKGVTAGKYTIKVFAKNYATLVSTFTITSNQNLPLPTLTLQKGASVSGTIRTQVGGKITKNDATMVIAATKDFKKVVFGSLNYIGNEIDDYSIVGLEPGVSYQIVLANPDTKKVYVDNKSTSAVVNDAITHPIVYTKLPPQFETKVFKINMGGLMIKGGTSGNLGNGNILPAGLLTQPMPGLFDSYGVDMGAIDVNKTYDLYYIFGYSSQSLMEEDISQIVSTTTYTVYESGVQKTYSDSGVLIPMYLDESRKSMMTVYIPAGDEAEGGTKGHFAIKFKGRNADSITGDETYIYYTGEDGRSEKMINPMMGGNLALGEGDATSIEVPSGVQFDGATGSDGTTLSGDAASAIAVSSGTKFTIIEVENENIQIASARAKLAPGKTSFAMKGYSTKLASASTYPGKLCSSIYDMQAKLVTGPLATLAKTSSVNIKLQMSSSTATDSSIEERDLALYHFNETTGGWDKESSDVTIDWVNRTLASSVNHFSKFAVFHVAGSGSVGTSTTTVTATSSGTVTTSSTVDVSTTVAAGSGSTAAVTIPAGTFANGTAVSITVPASIAAATNGTAANAALLLQKELTASSIVLEISAGGTQPGKDISLVITYADADITGLTASKLVVCYYDTTKARWVQVASTVNTTAKTITAVVKHLSLFAVFQKTAASTLDSVIVYPNPYKAGDTTYGDSFIGSGVVFAGLTANSKIRIFNIAGEKVAEISETDNDGQNIWDMKNSGGTKVASGVYIYYITDAAGNKTKGKLAIIK